MIGLWIFLIGIALYIIGSILDWFGNSKNGGRRR